MVVRRRQQPAWLPGGPRVSMVSAAVAMGALLVGCGGPGTDQADELAILGDRAERLAVHLDEGDGCAAEREGDELRSRTRDALAVERITRPVAAEILDVVDEVTSAMPCDDPPTDDEEADETPEAEQPPETEEPPEREEAPEAEEAPETEEAPEAEGPSESEQEDEETPPGRSEEGPPGQREGSGRGKGNA